jgi:hypothetical protein
MMVCRSIIQFIRITIPHFDSTRVNMSDQLDYRKGRRISKRAATGERRASVGNIRSGRELRFYREGSYGCCPHCLCATRSVEVDEHLTIHIDLS